MSRIISQVSFIRFKYISPQDVHNVACGVKVKLLARRSLHLSIASFVLRSVYSIKDLLGTFPSDPFSKKLRWQRIPSPPPFDPHNNLVRKIRQKVGDWPRVSQQGSWEREDGNLAAFDFSLLQTTPLKGRHSGIQSWVLNWHGDL